LKIRIRAKLEALGWRAELIMLGNDFDQYGLVSDPVELTDSGEHLVALMFDQLLTSLYSRVGITTSRVGGLPLDGKCQAYRQKTAQDEGTA
jgi:hypothetical protein